MDVLAVRPKTLPELMYCFRLEHGHSRAIAGKIMAELSKRRRPWSRQMINEVEHGRRTVSADFARDIGLYLGIGSEAALIIAGHFPWLPTVEQALQVVHIFKNGNYILNSPKGT